MQKLNFLNHQIKRESQSKKTITSWIINIEDFFWQNPELKTKSLNIYELIQLNKAFFQPLLSKFTDIQLVVEMLILICHGFKYIFERLEIIYNLNRHTTDFKL